MEPLCAAIGARQRVDAALDRMRRHGGDIAPVIRSGRSCGVVSRAQLEEAVRFGLSAWTAGDLFATGAPRVTPGASLRTIEGRARGTAVGLVVQSAGGAPLGCVSRAGLEKWLDPVRPRAGGAGRRLVERLSSADRALLSELIRVSRAAGADAYLVGGSVRDALMGSEVIDLDIVVAGKGIRFAGRLATRLRGSMTPHPRFGTAVVTVPGGRRIDVTSARSEIYDAPAALPRVRPGSLLEDMFRRDITINAIALPIGHAGLRDDLDGGRDLRAGILRVTHRLSILEDPTRAYRIARFASRFDMMVHRETRAALAIAARCDAYAHLTAERRGREFMLIFREPDPAGALRSLNRLGLLGGLVCAGPPPPDLRGTDRLQRGLRSGALAGVDSMAPGWSLYLAMLLHGAPPAGRRRGVARLGVRGRLAESVLRSRSLGHRLAGALDGKRRASAVTRACERAGPLAMVLAWCHGSGRARAAIERYLSRYRHVRAELGGHALKRLGIPPGPAYASIREKIRLARLDGRIGDISGELRLASRHAERSGPVRGGD